MIEALDFPLDVPRILRSKKSIKRSLLEKEEKRTINIAVLAGSTADELLNIWELFLLKHGFQPNFYLSDYNRYYEDAIFGNEKLDNFKPDIIYIHTTIKNILTFPKFDNTADEIKTLIAEESRKYGKIWDALQRFNCPVIQNNFELPLNRGLGNLDSYNIHGKTYFIKQINEEFGKNATLRNNLLLNDINYISAKQGLDNWFDRSLWYSSKYAFSFNSFPHVANNLTNLVLSIKGLSQKCLVLDLDNTCWGGVIGDDGINGIKLGKESAAGEAHMFFQEYVRELKDRGIVLAVSSKNDLNIAKEGFDHNDSILSYSDFVSFKANWEPKYLNIQAIASEINIGLDSLVFIDDNAMERSIVRSQLPNVKVPDVQENIVNFIDYIESHGYFEPISLSNEDLSRNKFYDENKQREERKAQFDNYGDFLKSLEMKAIIQPFDPKSINRVTQLINKTNQFNLRTKRYTIPEVENMASGQHFIGLHGRLIDKFGDNGIVTIIIGEISDDNTCTIDTWLMSCRVLKREMEFAMFNEFVRVCLTKGIKQVIGIYEATKKNKMVSDLYNQMTFEKVDDKEHFRWKLDLENYKPFDTAITIN